MKRQSLSIIGFLILTLMLISPVCAEKTPADFDGDGKTDLVVQRFSNPPPQFHSWYSLNSSDDKLRATQWGYTPGDGSLQTDLPVLGDFDGDGKTDIGAFRTTFALPIGTVQSYFYILRSRDSTIFAIQWGLNHDHEISQDYDGDGKTDVAVARSTLEGMIWYIYGSRDGFYSLVIPGSGFPIRGDYDGDGKADAALVRGGNITLSPRYFVIRKSSTGQVETTEFGESFYDYAVPGDYDGDGKTDIAAWGGKNEATGGGWRWIRSSDGGIGTTQLGTGTVLQDFPVQADYDGDGKTDPAIFRRGVNQDPNEAAYFLIRGTRRGYYEQHWGRGADSPPLFSLYAS